uniref:Nucleoside-diphosphate kinase n=1 Tax=Naja naja TaxID=35670 RepID=A0A8C6X9S9_NAJNA
FAAEKLKDSIIIFMIGGPGSGKDVQSIRLASKYDFSHVAIGELLWEEASRNTSKSKAIKDILMKGALVPSGYVLELLTDKMLKAENVKGFFIEGFPREINQARLFEEVVSSVYVLFDCSTETMIQRLMIRSQLGQRVNNNEKTIRQQLETHYTLCDPVLTYYLQRIVRGEGVCDIVEIKKVESILRKCFNMLLSHKISQLPLYSH